MDGEIDEIIRAYTDNDPQFAERYQSTGTERLDIESYFDPTLPQFQEGYWADYYKPRLNEAISEMQELKDICDKYGIRLTVVTNPLYFLTYERDVKNGYLDYLERLADVTDYYNFSSLSDISLDPSNYYETSHFTPDVGRLMINAAFYDDADDKLKSQGFGCHVDRDNVKDLIRLLGEQLNEG